jgi:hypothetical protein
LTSSALTRLAPGVSFRLSQATALRDYPDESQWMVSLYHITHVRNLSGILAAGCLCCDRLREEQGLTGVSIAHQHIKDRRKQHEVRDLHGRAVAAGGTLSDYVPFYFAPRSPMLFVIKQGLVSGYAEGQRPILHLETSTEKLVETGRPYAFTNGHAEMAISDYSHDLNLLDSFVDWQTMRSRYWNDTAENPDRKRRRQAEFLVHRTVPWTVIQRIGVLDRRMADDVESLLQSSSHRPLVVVEPGWYY